MNLLKPQSKLTSNFRYRNVQCGSLQCRDGDKQPISERPDLLFSRTIISIKGIEYECK